MKINITPALLFLIFLLPQELSAKLEYALKIQANRCTTCHSSPVGGGHRSLTGKAFGPKSAPLQSFSEQDIFGFDLRSIAYTPVSTKNDKDRSGLGVMAAIPSVSIPFSATEEGKEWRLVYSHNLGGFQAKANIRDAYLRVKFHDDYRLLPQFISIGRFNPPFGIITDEHRTYVRQQTKTSWDDFEMGILFSGDWSHSLHYDIALVNTGGGRGFGEELIYKWGAIANIRYMSSWGWVAGSSAFARQCLSFKDFEFDKENCSSAVSLYQALSLDSLTNDWFPGVLLAEVVAGHNTNSYLQGNSFVSSPESLNSVLKDKISVGSLVQLNYNFLPDWTFIVKYDYLTLDWEYRKDAYYRVGFGLRHFFNNQTSLQARYEKAIATPDEEENPQTQALASQDTLWFLLQIKL